MIEFTMPSLGADMETGTVYNWLVRAGDAVKRGDIVAEVETDKGVIEIEIFEDGVIGEIVVAEGTEVPVGAVLALVQSSAAEPAMVAAPEPVVGEEHHPMDHRPLVQPLQEKPVSLETISRLRISPRARRRAAELKVVPAEIVGTGQDGAITFDDIERYAASLASRKHRVTPLARRLADDLGVDTRTLTGTGPHGAICRADVESAAEKRAAPPKQAVKPAGEKPAKKPRTAPPEAMRQAIALAMARANREIPHYYLETTIDMSAALKWLEGENLRRPIKERLLPAVMLIQAVARALAEVPALNGFWRDDGLDLQEGIHIGFAIALRQGGLVTPAIHNADTLSLDEINEKLRDLIVRTRAGRLRGSELTDATVTVTSLGDLGVEKVFGVIYPPQIALIGLGKIVERPWAENGLLGVRPVMTATLAGDHRASDGLIGARFLEALNRNLVEAKY